MVDVSKVGQGSGKRYVNSRCGVRIIDEKGEAIMRLHQIIQNSTKGINIVSTTMGGMVQDLHNTGKEMEYYAAKLHQVDKRVEVSNMFSLWNNNLFMLTQLKLCKRILNASSYAAKHFFSSV